jgi:type VI secretion system protein ImpA
MSTDSELQALASPIASDQPCGEDLEDTQLLASFDGFRLFGQSTALPEMEWREVKTRALEAMQKSKDLRLLAHYAAASLRVDGWPAFLGSITLASDWLKDHFDAVYPRITDDAILRKNALNCFSDRMAVLDGVRRTPFISNRQIGSFSLRDLELATGVQAPTEADTAPATEDQINAAITAATLEELQAFDNGVGGAIDALKNIDSSMRNGHGSEGAPDFDPLVSLLLKVRRPVSEQLIMRGAQAGAATNGAGADGADGQAIAVGGIKTRQDAIRVLDAVATFFRQNEPSSPVPLFVERAKRLVGRDFMAVLEDIVPESLPGARAAGGVKDEVS